jgi:hypothetical protein
MNVGWNIKIFKSVFHDVVLNKYMNIYIYIYWSERNRVVSLIEPSLYCTSAVSNISYHSPELLRNIRLWQRNF